MAGEPCRSSKHRATGNPRCRRQAPSRAPLSDRIDQGGFARSRVGRSRRGQRRERSPPLFALAADGHADAGDGETAAGDNRNLRYTEIGGIFSRSAAFRAAAAPHRRWRDAPLIACMLKRGVNGDLSDIPQLRLVCLCHIRRSCRPRRAARNAPPSTPAWVQSRRRCRNCRGEADDGDDGTADALGGRHPRRQRSRQPAQKQAAAKTAIIREKVLIGTRLVKISMTRKLTGLCGF